LVERTAVGEASEGEGGEGFYIARSGRRADLLLSWGSGECVVEGGGSTVS
jgi:hypothetical protein